MNLTIFLTVLLVSHPSQGMAPPADDSSHEIPLMEQLAAAEQKVAMFRAEWAVSVSAYAPNEKLMTLERVVSELKLDLAGKEALCIQLKQLPPGNQAASLAEQSFLQAQELLCNAKDQLARVKAEQRKEDARLAEYLRLLEKRDNLRLKVKIGLRAIEPADLPETTIPDLMAAVNRSQAALERAQRIHQQTVNSLLEAVTRSAQPGANERLTQPDSAPAGE